MSDYRKKRFVAVDSDLKENVVVYDRAYGGTTAITYGEYVTAGGDLGVAVSLAKARMRKEQCDAKNVMEDSHD